MPRMMTRPRWLPIFSTIMTVALAPHLLPASPAGYVQTGPSDSAGRNGQEARDDQWKPGSGLLSRFAEDLDPANPLPEYPRPQLTRPAWTNLNGLWDYAITPASAEQPPEEYEGRILVPFPIESALSGVQKPLKPDQRLWYRRTFQKPTDLGEKRLLLHFGAVDWEAQVLVNGQALGDHQGGFDSFSFDITDALRDGENELVVAVRDPTDTGTQPIGKQRLEPRGIFYTGVSGIWQTVWLEPVPRAHIRGLSLESDIDAGVLRVTPDIEGVESVGASDSVVVEVYDGEEKIAEASGGEGALEGTIQITIAEPKLWSPQSPHLYDLKVRLRHGETTDEVSSYAALRKISLSAPAEGEPVRLLLNGEPVFQFGLLDQGWWPDGLYTAPTDEALRYDIEITKEMGFNMARKHVKVEPARWYYWTDKLGLLVWQDFPSSFAVNAAPDSERDPEMPQEAVAHWRREYRAMIDQLDFHPSVVVWVPFNEGWGQHDTNEMIEWTRKYDPTRPVGGPSGWADRGNGDLHDMHSYPGPSMFEPQPKRASVLGEFGGLGLPLEGHLWQEDRNWGYRTLESREQLERRYRQLITELRPLIRQGLAAAVYTQTTDVEGEVNGLLTYDRRVVKIEPETLRALHAPLYQPVTPAERVVILQTSEEQPQAWLYTMEQPAGDWATAGFDDATWRNGFGGFGTERTPGAKVRTEWNGDAIWLRRDFNLDEADFAELYVRIHHDEDAEIYLNGELVLELEGYSTGYRDVPLPQEAARLLKAGENVLAIHCRQTDGGQYIDAGLVELRPKQGGAAWE